MAAGSLGRKIEEEVACSVCLDPFLEPVLLDCGHNFCQACIVGWWEEFPTYTVCPQCPDTVQPRSFRPNIQLAKVVEMIKRLLRDLSPWEVCASHRKPLSYFCAVEKALTCVNCVESKEHRGHRVALLKDAVEEYKDHLLSIAGILTNRRKKILIDKLEVEKKAQDLSKKVGDEKRKMLSEFQLLHQFLLDQEEFLLASIQEVEEEIVDKRNEHIARAFRALSSVDSKVRVLERICQLPVDELMQDAGRILESKRHLRSLTEVSGFEECGELLKRLDAFLPEPEWRIPDLWALNVHLAGAIKQFRDSLVSIYQPQRGCACASRDGSHHN